MHLPCDWEAGSGHVSNKRSRVCVHILDLCRMPWPFLPQFPTGPLFSCPPSLQTHYCSYFCYESTHSPPRQGLELGIHAVIWRSSFCPAWMWLTPRVSIPGACRSACPLLMICPSFLSLLAHLSLPGWLWVFFLRLSPWDLSAASPSHGLSVQLPRAAAINMPFPLSRIPDKNVKWVRTWHGHLRGIDICHYHKCMAFEGRNQALHS